jgi:hypothetical protein
MTKLTFGQEAIQNIINQSKIEIGIGDIAKNYSDSDKVEITIASADIIQSAVSLGKNIPFSGIAISGVDLLNNISKNFYGSDKNDASTLEYITSVTSLAASGLIILNPISGLALGTLAVGLSVYALASGDDEQISQAVDNMLLTVGEVIGDTWGDSLKLLDLVDKEINNIADQLTSLSEQITNDPTGFFNNAINQGTLEASSILENFGSIILNTLLGQDKAHANFAESELQTLQTQINQSTNQANQFIAPPVRRDPLAFDLDGDGIEITNTNNGVMFDHNNNNVKTNTAWLSGNDAWLTLDKNKNGVIDNGAELFGDNTIKQDGTTAKDGIDALKDLDNNQDGIINNQDIQFANLKLWQDTNQDGISQQTELKTLSELGIKSIDLTRTGKNQQLTDAIQSDGLTFTKTDGTLGEVAELDLNQNEFFSKFTADGDFNTKEFNLKGTGLVRDLAGATSEDKTLSTLVSKLQATTNINEQTNTLDKVLYQWSKTAIQESIFNAEYLADGKTQNFKGQLISFDINQDLQQKLAVLETLGTQDILTNSNSWQQTTQTTQYGEVIVYKLRPNNTINSEQEYNNAYDSLKDYHFNQTLKQTQFKTWTNELQINFKDGEFGIDTTKLHTQVLNELTDDYSNALQKLTLFNNAYADKLNEYGFDYYQILKDSSVLFDGKSKISPNTNTLTKHTFFDKIIYLQVA